MDEQYQAKRKEVETKLIEAVKSAFPETKGFSQGALRRIESGVLSPNVVDEITKNLVTAEKWGQLS